MELEKKAKPNEYVYVISHDNKPLMPTRRYCRVKKLLKLGKAKIINYQPFVIQLLYETPGCTQPLILGIDPGTKTIGGVVSKENGEVVYAGELETRTKEVTENIQERKMHRQAGRRYKRNKCKKRYKKDKIRKGTFVDFEIRRYKIKGTKEELVCKGIAPSKIKFAYRKREKGWLTPTARHLLDSHKNFISKIKKILPISRVVLEYAQFDIQKMKDPEIQGKKYQHGTLYGFANEREYVLYRDKHTCQLCKKSHREFHAHHVIWKSDQGADTPENLITLCLKCHDRVHIKKKINEKVKKIFSGMKKRFSSCTLLNTIMPRFYLWLLENFSKVEQVYGYEVKELRYKHSVKKGHSLDAYFATLIGKEIQPCWENICVYQHKQFRRHNRQIIHARRDRNYYDPEVKEDKKIIAKNRNKRCGQLENSLVDYLEEKGKSQVGKLRVSPGKSMVRHKCKIHKLKRKDKKKKKKENRAMFDWEHKQCPVCNVFRPGDLVWQKTEKKCYVATGSGHNGYSVVLYSQKGYEPAKKFRLLRRNTGIVCCSKIHVAQAEKLSSQGIREQATC